MKSPACFVAPRASAMAAAVAGAATLWISACRTLDPADQVARVDRLASGRLGVTSIASDSSRPWNGDRPLTAAEAIDIAMRHAPALIEARPRLTQVRADLVDASQPPNPVFRWMVGVPIDSVEAVPFFLGLAQDLGYLLQRDALIEVAELELEREVLAVAGAFVEKAFEIEALHRSAEAAESRRRVACEQAALAEAMLRLAEDREAVGEGTPSETALAEARVRHARAVAVEAGRLEQQSKLALLLAMGRPGLPLDWSAARSPAPVEPVDPWETPHGESPVADRSERHDRSGDESESVRAALTNRLDLLAADLAACARFESIGIAANSIWNSLSFGVGFDRDMEGMRGVPFSGAVPIPIFDDGSVPRARAEAAWQLAMIERFELAQTIEAEVRAAWIDRRAAIETLEAREAEQRDLDRALDSTRAAYDAGFEPLEEVLRLEARRLEVVADTIDARAALDLSRIALRRAIGGAPDPVRDSPPIVSRHPDRLTEDRS